MRGSLRLAGKTGGWPQLTYLLSLSRTPFRAMNFYFLTTLASDSFIIVGFFRNSNLQPTDLSFLNIG
jgi:hypothetical protein